MSSQLIFIRNAFGDFLAAPPWTRFILPRFINLDPIIGHLFELQLAYCMIFSYVDVLLTDFYT